MAVREGWYTKSDSKWKTMPEVMLRYRAAAFFGRLYAPEIMLGMHSSEEVVDGGMYVEVGTTSTNAAQNINRKITPVEEMEVQDAEVVEVVPAAEPTPATNPKKEKPKSVASEPSTETAQHQETMPNHTGENDEELL
jgi:hypothetical protein